MDRITEIIQNTLSVIQKKKKVVLIIDDLDRVDPEHIFRLINVFSAYVDQDSSHNLFGFDHVIFVCDLENIKSIYHHRYGENTNFYSYIDKFYGSPPFEYDFFKILGDNIYRLLKKNKVQENYDWGNGSYDKIILILRYFINANILSTRTILNCLKNPTHYQSKFYAIGIDNRIINSEEIPIIQSFVIIQELLGKDLFIDLAKKLNQSQYNPYTENQIWELITKDCIILSNWKKHNYEITNEGTDLYSNPYSFFCSFKSINEQITVQTFTIKERLNELTTTYKDCKLPLTFEKEVFYKSILEFHRLPKKHMS